MVCCLLLALVLGPVGLWAVPRARSVPDCCVDARRTTILLAGLTAVVVALCVAAWLLLPEVHRICRVFP